MGANQVLYRNIVSTPSASTKSTCQIPALAIPTANTEAECADACALYLGLTSSAWLVITEGKKGMDGGEPEVGGDRNSKDRSQEDCRSRGGGRRCGDPICPEPQGLAPRSGWR